MTLPRCIGLTYILSQQRTTPRHATPRHAAPRHASPRYPKANGSFCLSTESEAWRAEWRGRRRTPQGIPLASPRLASAGALVGSGCVSRAHLLYHQAASYIQYSMHAAIGSALPCLLRFHLPPPGLVSPPRACNEDSRAQSLQHAHFLVGPDTSNFKHLQFKTPPLFSHTVIYLHGIYLDKN